MLKENCNIFLNKAHFNEKMNNGVQRETPVQYATHQLWCHHYSTILLLVIFRTVAQWPLIIKSCSRDHPPQLNPYFLHFEKAPAGVLLPMWTGSWTKRHPIHAPRDRQRCPPLQALPSLLKFKGTTRSSLHPGANPTQRSQVPQQMQPEARGGMGHDGAWGA